MAIMNRQQVKELLPIIQAFAEGKPYRYKRIQIGAIWAMRLILILVSKDTASSPTPSTAHSKTRTSAGRKCKNTSLLDG